MSTPSMLLLCAGAAASLAGVWTLAGLSESSPLRGTPRVVAAAAVGLLGAGVWYGRAPAELRSELSLVLLFAAASVIALAVGAAKLEGALAEKDGPRAVRRAAGIVAGTFFGMAAVGAASLDLSASSLQHARVGWALMFALVASAVVVFLQRARYAGVAVLALGQRVLVLLLVAGALLAGARLTVAAPPVVQPVRLAAPPATAAEAPLPSAPAVSASAVPQASVAPAPSLAAAPSGRPGELQIEAITARGLLEADARGGISRRFDKLQACLQSQQNLAGSTLSFKVGIDASGSVAYAKALPGELAKSPLATCMLPQLYKMGFAAPASENAGFEITFRLPPQ